MIKAIFKIITDPDWLQAIAAIATLPITVIAIVKLFKKDKEREQQISSLAQLAKSQAEQLIEVRKQNEIFQSQLEISKDLHLMKKIKADKENKEKMKEIRPYFRCSGSNRKGEEVTLTMKNHGYTATKINISNSNCENIVFRQTNKYMDKIDNNFTFSLLGQLEDIEKPYSFTLKIEFSDDDENRYYQELYGKGFNVTPQEPVLISEKDTINV